MTPWGTPHGNGCTIAFEDMYESTPNWGLDIEFGEPESGLNNYGFDYTDLLASELKDKDLPVKKKFRSTRAVSWKEPLS